MPTLSLEMGKTINECPGYEAKPSNSEASVLELWGMWSTLSLPLLPGPLSPWVVVFVKVPSMGQIELFNHLLYLKPFNCVQTNEHWLILKILPTNYSLKNHMYKQDLALNKPQWLICHKTQPTKTSLQTILLLKWTTNMFINNTYILIINNSGIFYLITFIRFFFLSTGY